MSELTAQMEVTLPGFALALELAVAAGEVLCLYGPSGSGKTTALRALAGLEPALRGKVALGGAVWHSGAQQLVPPHRRQLGYMVQSPQFFDHLTVQGNLAFVAQRSGGGDPEEIARAVGLTCDLDRGVAGLSGGEAQRLALAQVLLRKPRALLLDEPFAALDLESRAALMAQVRRIVDALGIPAVLVSHEAEEVAALADRVAWIAEGRLTGQGGFPDGQGGAATPFGALVTEDGWLEVGSLRLTAPEGAARGQRLRLLIGEGDVLLSDAPVSGSSALGGGAVNVRSVDVEGGHSRLQLDAGGVDFAITLRAAQCRELDLTPGGTLHLTVLRWRVLGASEAWTPDA